MAVLVAKWFEFVAAVDLAEARMLQLQNHAVQSIHSDSLETRYAHSISQQMQMDTVMSSLNF